MKKIMALLFLILSFTSFTNVQAAQVKHIVFFGDSLTDNGNLYELLLKLIPQSPPYFNGRFSNGYTWAEHFGKYYYDKYYIDYKIYAYGGATAIFRVSGKFVSPATLGSELNQYLVDTLGTDKGEVLYSIWIGANDYLFAETKNPDAAAEQVVNQIKASINRLINSGAKYFLLLNLPDLSRTPYGTQNGLGHLHMLSLLHNQKLDIAIAEIKKAHPDVKITLFNIYDLFNDVMKNPLKYNEKYHVNITNLTQACLQNNLTDMQSYHTSLTDQINQALKANYPDAIDNQEQAMEMSRYVMETKELAYTYSMGKSYLSGNVPCANANEHLFWDPLHPSAMIHDILSQLVIEQMQPMIV